MTRDGFHVHDPARDTVRARRPHLCCWCDRVIHPGERHISRRVTPWESRAGGGDEVFWTYRSHSECDRVASIDDIFDVDMNFVDSWEFRFDHLGEPDTMAGDDDPLVYRMRREWRRAKEAADAAR